MSVSLVLFLIGIFLIAGTLSNELSVFMKENFSFSIILNDEAKESSIREMQKTLDGYPFIKSTKYISQEVALKEMIAELGEDPQVFLGFNPFQASIEVRLNSEYMNADSLRAIEKQLKSYTNVSELMYQENMLNVVNRNIRQVSIVLFMLILLLMLISFTLISNTIRLLIYSRRFLIYTMRLVGATPDFIRRPFLKRSILNGFIAGVLAILMLIGALHLQERVFGLDLIIPHFRISIIYFTIILIGMTISGFSAYMAVNRYLRMSRGKMYHI
jgi:cell division transport system permease protein